MAYWCCEAVHDEAGRLGWEGLSVAGDQYDTEVIKREIRVDGERWQVVYRPKDPAKAYIIGECSVQLALNNMVGYDQSDRLSLYYAWRAMPDNKRNIMNIAIPCNCDCSSGTAVCILSANIKIDPNMRTAVQDKVLMATGEFLKIPYQQGMKLFKGDVLWREGHTGIVGMVDSEPAPLFIGEVKKLSGVYKTAKNSVLNHVAAHPYLGAGNRVNVLKTVYGKKHKFYYVDIVGVKGYVLASRIKVAK